MIIISVDGLRPDMALRANMPRMRELLKEGSFSFWARTIPMAITLPSHTSMLTGVSVEKHGISFNGDIPEGKPMVYAKVPTLFELAKANGYTTAVLTAKSKFDPIAKPGSVDWLDIPKNVRRTDPEVAAKTAAIIKEHHLDVLFMHVGSVDGSGHSVGWGTDQQIAAIETADACIGTVVDAAKAAGVWDDTLLIVTADHGGAGRTHGKDDFRSRHIPWIAVGPTLRKNYDLTRVRELEINTEDTFATACYVMGIDPGKVDGKPILQIFEPPKELLQDAPAKAGSGKDGAAKDAPAKK